ncbi:MAG: radical SAM protein [Planctomycetes bacterium]|nr:radical SAM protein [Planctomycetota bacterium]
MAYKSDTDKADRITESAGFPAVVLIDNTSACNLRCSMCDHVNIKHYRKIETMKWDLYAKIIDEIARESPDSRIWQIFYGDPFLLKDMPERIRYAKDQGLTDVVLNTNGVLMTEQRSRPLIEAGLDAIYVGVDAATKESYDQIRVGGDFDAVVANVLTYRDLLRQHGRPEQKIFVQYVVSDINEHETDEFREFWAERNVDVKIRPRVSWAGLIDAPNLQPNEQVQRRPCYWLMRTINICTDGRVAFCSADPHCRVPCGAVRTHSIKELWAGQLREYRKMHAEGRFDELPEMCRECMDWQSAYAEFFAKPTADAAGVV